MKNARNHWNGLLENPPEEEEASSIKTTLSKNSFKKVYQSMRKGVESERD